MNRYRKTHTNMQNKVVKAAIITYMNKNPILASKHPQGSLQVSPNFNFVNEKFMWSSSMTSTIYNKNYETFSNTLENESKKEKESKKAKNFCFPS